MNNYKLIDDLYIQLASAKTDLESVRLLLSEARTQLAEAEKRAEVAEEVLEKFPAHRMKDLPHEWCEDCLSLLLRFNRKSGIECCAYEDNDHPIALDDGHYKAINSILRWAQDNEATLTARQGEGGGTND